MKQDEIEQLIAARWRDVCALVSCGDEDFVSEAAVQLARICDKPSSQEDAFRLWVFIARRRRADHFRKLGRRSNLATVVTLDHECSEEPADHRTMNPLEIAIGNEEVSRLTCAMAELRKTWPLQYDVIVKHHLQHMSPDEIASELGKSRLLSMADCSEHTISYFSSLTHTSTAIHRAEKNAVVISMANLCDTTQAIAIEYVQSGRLELPPGSRDDLVKLLETLLSDDEALLIYSAGVLQPHLQDCETGNPFTQSQEAAIMHRSWSEISDQLIATLLLRPQVMARLNHRINYEMPDEWVSVLVDAGRRLLERTEIVAANYENSPFSGKEEQLRSSGQYSLAASTEDNTVKFDREVASPDATQHFRLERTGDLIIVRLSEFTLPANGVARLFVVRGDHEREAELAKPFNTQGEAVVDADALADVYDGLATLLVQFGLDSKG